VIGGVVELGPEEDVEVPLVYGGETTPVDVVEEPVEVVETTPVDVVEEPVEVVETTPVDVVGRPVEVVNTPEDTVLVVLFEAPPQKPAGTMSRDWLGAEAISPKAAFNTPLAVKKVATPLEKAALLQTRVPSNEVKVVVMEPGVEDTANTIDSAPSSAETSEPAEAN
jgi:hypothetical protein